LRHIAPHCATLRHIAPHCATLRHIAPHCATLHHIAQHCATLHHIAPHCATLHHIAPHCATLRHIAPHCAKVPFYHNQFTVAGIPEKLEQLKRERQYLRRREGTRKLKRLFTVFGYVVPLALTGPIRTVFYLYLGMLGVRILGYLMEIMRTTSPRLIVQKLRSSSGKILQCLRNECKIIIYFVLGLGKPIHCVLRLLRRSFYLRLSPKCWPVNRK